MAERDFQRDLVKEIKDRFSNEVMVLKTDPGQKVGIPDLLILYKDRWASLECKASPKSKHRPGQDRFVEKMNGMSFSSFIYPENKEDVLNAMERSLKFKR